MDGFTPHEEALLARLFEHWRTRPADVRSPESILLAAGYSPEEIARRPRAVAYLPDEVPLGALPEGDWINQLAQTRKDV